MLFPYDVSGVQKPLLSTGPVVASASSSEEAGSRKLERRQSTRTMRRRNEEAKARAQSNADAWLLSCDFNPPHVRPGEPHIGTSRSSSGTKVEYGVAAAEAESFVNYDDSYECASHRPV